MRRNLTEKFCIHAKAPASGRNLRKGASNDPVEEISGSTGLTGAVDIEARQHPS